MMRGLYAIAFTVLLGLLATPVLAADCDANSTQMDMNECAAAKLKQADDEMNQLYKQKMAALATAEHKQRFLNAQRAWLTYRDKSCLYEVGSQSDSGSIWPLEQDECLAKFTAERVKILKDYADCTQDGCPN